jgi:hypothetical protein
MILYRMWVTNPINLDAYYLNLVRYTQHEKGRGRSTWMSECFDGHRWHTYPEGGEVLPCMEITGFDLQKMGNHPFTELIFGLIEANKDLMEALTQAAKAYAH